MLTFVPQASGSTESFDFGNDLTTMPWELKASD
jgi:hypothetical protein